MSGEAMNDELIDRMIGDLRSLDRGSGPEPAFVARLGVHLRAAGPEPASRRRFGFGWSGIGRLAPVASLLIVIALVGATVFSTWDRGRQGDVQGYVPAVSTESASSGAVAASPSADGSPVASLGEIPTAEELLGMCDVQRRADGQAEAMLATTTWNVTTSMPFLGIEAPLYVADVGLGYANVDANTGDALNAVLARLYACSVRDIGASLFDSATHANSLDGYFLANFSDNFLRRAEQRTSIWPGETWWPIPNVLDGLGADGHLVVQRAWDVVDWDVPRVAAYVTNTSTRWNPQYGYLMTFVQVDGAWQIDEVALATEGAIDPSITPGYTPARVGDLMLFDHGTNPTDPNYDFYSPSSFGPYEQDAGAFLRVFNFSSVEQTVTIPDLGIAVTVPAGGAATVPIDGEPGRYSIAVDPLAGDEVLEVQIVAPGTVLEGKG